MKVVAIVLAAGVGKRMHSDVAKQFLPLQSRPLICYSLDVFNNSPHVDEIILVTGADAVEYCQKEIVEKYGYRKVSRIAVGGKERYHSVWKGLQMSFDSTEEKADYVLIHDGARPFVSEEIIERNLEALKTERACVTGMPSKDTVKIATEEGFVSGTPNRSLVWLIQTPQSFEFDIAYEAYRKLIESEEEILSQGIQVTDDAMVVEHFSKNRVKLVEGSYENIKITTPEDLPIAECFLERMKK